MINTAVVAPKFLINHQSINQSINQSISQSVSQSINQSINKSINQSTYMPKLLADYPHRKPTKWGHTKNFSKLCS